MCSYLYTIGQQVHVGLDSSTIYVIQDRRCIERDLFGDYAEYLCLAQDGTATWEGEADLVAVEEPTP